MLLVTLWKRNCCNVYVKEKNKTIQKEFRVEKVVKRRCNKLYAKWNDWDNSFNSEINKKIYSINE